MMQIHVIPTEVECIIPALPRSVHCSYTAACAPTLPVHLQPSFSLHCSYTETLLPIPLWSGMTIGKINELKQKLTIASLLMDSITV